MPPKGKKYGLGHKKSFELELPSGETCLVRRTGIDGLISAGVLDSLDSLTGMVKELHLDRVTGAGKAKAGEPDEQETLLALIKDKQRWNSLMDLVNAVCAYAVVEPSVSLPPEPGKPRDSEVLYTDQVDLPDRMAIMKAVLGGEIDKMQGMQPFREGGQEPLAGVGAGESVQHPPQPANGAGKGTGSLLL